MNGNDLLAQIENENPKLGIYLRNYLIPTIQPRGRAGQVLATPPDAVGNASLRNLSDLVNSSNPPSASYVGTDKSGGIVVAPTPAAGITALTGDVDASGSGSVSATVKGVNGASIPLSEAYLGTNGSGQIIPASAPSSGITQLTGDVTAGPGSGSQAAQVVATHLTAPLPVAQGGSGTAAPSLVAGTNVTISGVWPNQTVNASGTGMANPMTTAGDLIVGGAAGAPTRLAAGTSGYVLTSGGPGVAPSYQPGGGGSGGLLMLFPALFGGPVPTISGTGLTTAYNQAATFSATNQSQGIFLMDTAAISPGGSLEGILKAYPGTPFTLTSVFSTPLGMGTDSIGLIVADTLSGKAIELVIQPGSGGILVATFSSPTSFSSVPASMGIGNAPLLGFRIVDDGTNVTFFVSTDGQFWVQVYTVAKASSWLGSGGFNYIGAKISPTKALASTLLYWSGA